MIELRNISKVFHDSKKRKVNALNNINLTFSNQGFYSIVGKSGSGKSTLLNILSGLIKPSEGDYSIFGVNTNTFNEQNWADIRRTTLSYVFQEHNLIDHLTVVENLSIPLMNKKVNHDEIQHKIIETLTQFDLDSLKDQMCMNLSGGEKQRIAIIRSLLSESLILIADEPTSALDEINTTLVYDLLKEVSKTRLVIVVTHDMEMTNRYSDVIIQLNYGNVVSNNPPITIPLQNQRSVSNPKLQFNKIYVLSRFFNRGQWVMNVFMILFISIGMTLLSSTFAITQFNENNFDYHIIKDKVDLNFISTSDIHLYTNDLTSDMNLNDILPDLMTYKAYNKVSAFHSGLFHDNLSNTRLFTTIVIKPLEDDYIEITDYQANILKEAGIVNYNRVDELNGTTLSIYGITLTILDVIHTQYDLNNIIPYDIEVKYDVLSINENTLNKLIYYTYPKLINDAEDTIQALHPYTLERMTYGAYIGSNQLSNLDIVVDITTLQRWLNITFDSPEDAIPYFDSNITIDLMIDNQVISQTYRLKGVVFTDMPSVYFSETTYHDYFYESSNFDQMTSTQAFKVNNYDDFINIKSHLENNQMYILNAYSRDAYYAKSFIMSIIQIFTALVIFSFVMVSLLIYFFTYVYFKQNRFNYGILLSMGYERKTTLYIGIVQIIRNIVISFIISTLSASIIIYIFNQGYQSDLNIQMNIITFSLYPYLVTILISIIVSVFGILTVYQFIRKIDIIQLLK